MEEWGTDCPVPSYTMRKINCSSGWSTLRYTVRNTVYLRMEHSEEHREDTVSHRIKSCKWSTLRKTVRTKCPSE